MAVGVVKIPCPQLFYARPHADEICRQSGAWGAQRVGEIVPTRLEYVLICVII